MQRKNMLLNFECNHRPLVKLYEPRQEVEVLILFSVMKALRSELFEFKIIDYNTSNGIDALCLLETGQGGLQKGNLRYVEFKRFLTNEFQNHTFTNVTAIVCWECNLENGDKITDFLNNERTLCITKTKDITNYTLVPPPELIMPPIKVYVLKNYLFEKLEVSFERPLNPE